MDQIDICRLTVAGHGVLTDVGVWLVFYFFSFDQVIATSSARGGVSECNEHSGAVSIRMGAID